MSAVFLVAGHKNEFLEMVKYADFVFGNEDETKAWGQAHGYQTDSLLEITALISKMEKIDHSRPRYVITTQGKDPVLMSSHDFVSGNTVSKEYEVDLIPASRVVDLNGAGDAFVGGFLAEFALGKSIDECIRAGQWMSSYIIQVSGTNFPYPCQYHTKQREQTFLMIKPDGVQRGLVGDIIQRWEKRGFKLVGLKMLSVTRDHAEKHYDDLKERPFFAGLCDFICSGPVVAMVWEGDNVVAQSRTMIGATKPSASNPGTVRGDFAIDVGRNVIHGSDSVDNGKKEIELWFGKFETNKWESTSNTWIYE